MQSPTYFPHVDLLAHAMRINRDRLNSRAKVAIDAKLLRRIIEGAIAALPFSAEFYRETYPDIAAAETAGQIVDLHRHFVQTGYFEGRMGFPPPLDEAYYRAAYADVASALQQGEVASGRDHYLRAGAAEGRVPGPALKAEVEAWVKLLGVPVMTEA